MGYAMRKYPRTPHLQGSRLQPGDEDLSQRAFEEIKGKHIVIEEKIDGANAAVSFDTDGTLLLQSRGHYLRGGAREGNFDLFKQWATVHQHTFYEVLGTRYIMYGEWMYTKHRVYYDALPHYFMEFDIYDRERDVYLDTEARRALTARMPISSVPVLAQGSFRTREQVLALLTKSHYIREGHIERMVAYCEESGIDPAACLAETDQTNIMEGLYIKVEEGGCVTDRLKYVRAGFSQVVMAENHRRTVPNLLAVPLESLFEESV